SRRTRCPPPRAACAGIPRPSARSTPGRTRPTCAPARRRVAPLRPERRGRWGRCSARGFPCRAGSGNIGNRKRYRLPGTETVGGMAMSSSEKIARAYGVLAARGDKLTVRGVQREAGERIGEVAAWMREHAGGTDRGVAEVADQVGAWPAWEECGGAGE